MNKIICHYNNEGLLHSTTGPAVQYEDGFKMWYVDGLYAGNSNCRFDFTNRLIEIKQHQIYPSVKIYVVLDSFKDKYSLIFVDGMEKLIVS